MGMAYYNATSPTQVIQSGFATVTTATRQDPLMQYLQRTAIYIERQDHSRQQGAALADSRRPDYTRIPGAVLVIPQEPHKAPMIVAGSLRPRHCLSALARDTMRNARKQFLYGLRN